MESQNPETITLHHPVFQPSTTEELEEQWRRWKSDEHDLHDVIVALQRDRIREILMGESEEYTAVRVHIFEERVMAIRHQRERETLLVKRRFELGLSLPNGWRDIMEGNWATTPEEEAERILANREPSKMLQWLDASMVA